tara:strand:- start:108 stop:701 length:594 start_codon:yes stop_codon:yes gene_type:complete
VDVLGDYKFIINYDSTQNYESVKDLYETNIRDCVFTNDMETSWVDKTIEMVGSVTTPYIYYLFEDAGFADMVTREYFNKMLNEFHSTNAKHLLLGKTGKYKDPVKWKNTICETHKTIRTFNSNVPFNCCYPLAGIWDKHLFLEVLLYVKDNIKSKSAIKQIDGCEDLSNKFRSRNVKQACPLSEVTLHIQDVMQANR